MNFVNNHSKCSDCPGLCCRYMDIPVAFTGWTMRPQVWIDFDYLRWMLLHVGEGSPIAGVVIDTTGMFSLRIRVPCSALNEEGKCGVYESRPATCRVFVPDDCAKDSSDSPPEHRVRRFIRSMEDLEKLALDYGVNLSEIPKSCALTGAT